MSALICGCIAYDNIMVFPDRFKEHILPEQIHMLDVSFLVPELRREFGGCGANIAYNLNLLGADPLIMATVGSDFEPYRARLEEQGLDLRYVRLVADTLTAQAYITTDLDDNQITAFHPGAMDHAHLNRVPTDGSVSIGIVSTDGRTGMLEHAAQFAEAGIPFIFDPGKGLPLFSREELRRFVEQATWVIVNDYNGQLLQNRTGWDEQAIAELVQAYIVTRGGNGSTVFVSGGHLELPAIPPADLMDPTGCGDAYRAGLLFGLSRNMTWEDTGRLASLLGALKIAHRGTQNHSFTRDGLAREFQSIFGYDICF